MKASELCEAMEIFEQFPNQDVACEHGEIYAGPPIEHMTPGAIDKLTALGWLFVEQYNCWMTYV